MPQMDVELKAIQRIQKVLAPLTPSQRTNVMSYVGRRAETEHYEAMRPMNPLLEGAGIGAGVGGKY